MRLRLPVMFGGGGYTYTQKVLATESASLIGYWPLSEASGTTADNAEGTAARDGAYNSDVSAWPVAIGIGDGLTCPTFDVDLVDVYTASMIGAFSGAAGTVELWYKMSGAGVWTDSTPRIAMVLRADANNQVRILRTTANGVLYCTYKAGGTEKAITISGLSSTAWTHIAITWDKAADEMKAFYNGSQSGSTQTGLGVWAGALHPDYCIIGAASVVVTGPWSGYIAHAALWSKALTPTQIASLGAL